MKTSWILKCCLCLYFWPCRKRACTSYVGHSSWCCREVKKLCMWGKLFIDCDLSSAGNIDESTRWDLYKTVFSPHRCADILSRKYYKHKTVKTWFWKQFQTCFPGSKYLIVFLNITYSDVHSYCNVSPYVIKFLSAIGCDTNFCRVLTNHSQVNKRLVPYFRVQRIF